MAEIPWRPGTHAWQVAGDAFIYLDAHAGWCLAMDIDDVEALSLAEAIDYLGPEEGALAPEMMRAAMRALLVRGTALHQAWQDDLREGEAACAVRAHAAAHAHTAHAAGVMRSRAALCSEPSVAPGDVSYGYLAQVVECDAPGRWRIFAHEDDDDPVLLRLWWHPEPGDVGGWKWSRASREGIATRWQVLDVTGACEWVGPLHAGALADATRAALPGIESDLAARLAREVAAAGAGLSPSLDALARDHARRAARLAGVPCPVLAAA